MYHDHHHDSYDHYRGMSMSHIKITTIIAISTFSTVHKHNTMITWQSCPDHRWFLPERGSDNESKRFHHKVWFCWAKLVCAHPPNTTRRTTNERVGSESVSCQQPFLLGQVSHQLSTTYTNHYCPNTIMIANNNTITNIMKTTWTSPRHEDEHDHHITHHQSPITHCYLSTTFRKQKLPLKKCFFFLFAGLNWDQVWKLTTLQWIHSSQSLVVECPGKLL